MIFMHIRFLHALPILFLLLLAGCTEKKHIRGKEYVDREVLVDILVDIHLVDGVTNARKFYRRYEHSDSIDLLGPILEKYDVTQAQLDTTLAAYSRHPELLDQVYSDVLMELNVMLDELDENDPQ